MLTDSTLTAVRRHRQQQAEEGLRLGPAWDGQDLMFPNYTGGPQDPGTASTRFKDILRRLGLPAIRFHDLRHTTATLMLANGEHPKIVQECPGHSDIAMTLNRDLHVTMDMQRNAADRMARLLAGAM
jgi:integrase